MTMKPFLRQIAERFYAEYGTEVSHLAFVFPNRRAGLFFQKYLSEIAEKPMFSPTILTINDLFIRLSGKQTVDHLRLLFLLYTIYKEKSGSSETFDEFLYWGEMLISDFDDVDKYLADARLLFSNISDLRALDELFVYLSSEQVEAIRTFWSSFHPKGISPNQREFLALWEILYDLYSTLKERLSSEGLGYEGMIFREVVESLEHDEPLDISYSQIVFVGLNALSAVEIRFLQELQRRNLADFYWDYASPCVLDPENRASFFAIPNKQRFPSRFILPEEESPVGQEIVTIGIPSGIGQAKQVFHLLKELCNKHLLEGEEALRTAIVLPDEHMLVPVLNAIPEEIRHINVTMGYPLSGTPVASLMDYIVELQRNIRFIDRKPMFYFRDVLPVLNHRYVALTYPEVVTYLVQDISKNNRIYIPAEDLGKVPLLVLLFSPITDVMDFSDYLIRILEELNKRLSVQISEEEKNDEKPRRIIELEQEFVFHYFTIVNRMKDIRQSGIEMRMETYFKLLQRLTESITIPFQGEPLSGLQVMGVLETRALDFDRLIILSMNEGVFPQKKAANSFIPYNLRRGFGLPTYEHQDSVWAYHFYRLLFRASQVNLLYDTRSNGLQTGERSRFIHQLHYHYGMPLKNQLLVYDVTNGEGQNYTVTKDKSVQVLLAQFRRGGERALSASAINIYLDCPLKFYYAVIENIQEDDEVAENIENDVFGSILHKTLEILYKPFIGKMVTDDLLQLIQKDDEGLQSAIAQAFAEIFFKTTVIRPLEGQNYLIGEMIGKYIRKVLDQDRKLTPFHYVNSERLILSSLKLSDGSEVQLKGFIDRVDCVRNRLRIVDYKSGKGTSDFACVDTLFDSMMKNRPKAIMQVFFYAWMYAHSSEWEGREIKPVIYYMRSLFDSQLDFSVYQKVGRGKRDVVDSFSVYADDFENRLRQCLDEIFNEKIPFIQTSHSEVCQYCQFSGLCGR